MLALQVQIFGGRTVHIGLLRFRFYCGGIASSIFVPNGLLCAEGENGKNQAEHTRTRLRVASSVGQQSLDSLSRYFCSHFDAYTLPEYVQVILYVGSRRQTV